MLMPKMFTWVINYQSSIKRNEKNLTHKNHVLLWTFKCKQKGIIYNIGKINDKLLIIFSLVLFT